MRRQRLAILLLLLLCSTLQLQAEIAHSSLAINRISQEESLQESHILPSSCPQRVAYEKMLSSIDDVEDLYVDVPVHIALEQRQKKR